MVLMSLISNQDACISGSDTFFSSDSNTDGIIKLEHVNVSKQNKIDFCLPTTCFKSSCSDKINSQPKLSKADEALEKLYKFNKKYLGKTVPKSDRLVNCRLHSSSSPQGIYTIQNTSQRKPISAEVSRNKHVDKTEVLNSQQSFTPEIKSVLSLNSNKNSTFDAFYNINANQALTIKRLEVSSDSSINSNFTTWPSISSRLESKNNIEASSSSDIVLSANISNLVLGQYKESRPILLLTSEQVCKKGVDVGEQVTVNDKFTISPVGSINKQKINDDNVVFNVKTFEDLIAYQEEELQGDHSIGSPTLNLEYDDGVDNKNNSTSKLINFNLGTSDKKRRNITTNKSLEISSSNDSDDETNNISEESLKEGMLKRSNNQRNTSLKINAKMTLSSVDASFITEEVSVILEDNGNVHNADYYSNSFQSDDIVDQQNVSHQDVGVQTTNDCLSWRECIPPGLLEDRRPIIEGLSPCGPVDVAINQMLRQQIQLTRHLIASQCAMYKAYTTSVKFMRERYKPVTLNETKKFIKRNQEKRKKMNI